MIKRSPWLWCAGLVLLMLWPVSAQDEYPKIELFGGLGYINIGTGATTARETGLGVGGSLSGNFNRRWGVTVDYTRQFGSHLLPPDAPPIATPFFPRRSAVTSQLLFGPRMTARHGGVTGFAHVLLGAAHLRIKDFSGSSCFLFCSPPPRQVVIPGRSETGFAVGLGGGVDIHFKYAGLRIVQVDYIPARMNAGWTHNVRVQTGMVVRWGFR